MPPTAPPAPASTPGHPLPMAYAQVIVQAMQAAAVSPSSALRQAQITPTQLQRSQARLTARQLEVLSGTAMQALDDEALGAFSRRLPWGSYGMLARASISSANLGLAMHRWCRHHGLIAPDLALRLDSSAGGGSAQVEIQEGPEHAALAADAREFSLVHLLRNLHGLACWFVDSRIPLQAVQLPFAAPAHAGCFAPMFGTEPDFGAPRAALRFDAGYLALPLRRDERSLNLMLQRALPLTLVQYRRDRLLVEQVRQVMAAHPRVARGAAEVARALNLSVRTLHRQLREEGASLQQLKDEVRFGRASELLWRSARPIKQVAAAVGFESEKSFIRAFKAWSGRSPGEFRSGGV
ncbi:AraC family transcriptional regulator [Ramlibacter sp. AW1]|uniref:AraC family transcriptional regulator n=1 Tax=Ramlibacter aurantiacus TaxID=2801330 RepID=A0A936ZIX6_9BURK|nr:AraC family transcriptional regulator [Ramlibacter aurantiacus]MBL0421752.1 AraC family transcriptional regulator [Ramlibacter aurantiacus]